MTKEYPVYPSTKRDCFCHSIGNATRAHIAAGMIRIHFKSRYGITCTVYGIEMVFDGKAYYLPNHFEIRG